MDANITLYLDTRRAKADGKYPVKLRVYYNGTKTKENRGKGYNIAITPWAADNCLRLDTVAECTIYKKSGYIIVDNENEAIVEDGKSEFVYTPITNANEHYGKDLIYNVYFPLMIKENLHIGLKG